MSSYNSIENFASLLITIFLKKKGWNTLLFISEGLSFDPVYGPGSTLELLIMYVAFFLGQIHMHLYSPGSLEIIHMSLFLETSKSQDFQSSL